MHIAKNLINTQSIMERLFLLFIITIIFACNDSRTAEECYADGMESYEDSSFNNALKQFSCAVEKNNSDANSYYFKALCEIRLKMSKEAMISLQNALRIDSSNTNYFIERGKLKVVLGDYNSAIEDCNHALILDNSNPKTYIIKGLAYESINDRDNAINCYKSAIQYDQSNGEIYYKLGILQLSNRNEACTYLSKAGELGYMEAFEMIKINCNPRYKKVTISNSQTDDNNKFVLPIDKTTNSSNSTYKNSDHSNNKFKQKGTKTITSYGIDVPEIKVGEVFGEREDYKIKAISSKTGEYYYQYTKTINSLIYGRSVDYLVVVVKNNVINRFMFLLYPKSNDVGVPAEMAKIFERDTGYTMDKVDNTYGIRLGNAFVTITRVDEEGFGGDRIMLSVRNTI